jgi:mannosyl-3-phosphoglycerate phosphatase
MATDGSTRRLDLALVIVSDVDGCLIDCHTYSARTTRDAVAELACHGVPLVLCSSKTRAELEELRLRLGISDQPFISENGAAVHVPDGYFPFEIPGARRNGGGEDVVVFGRPYDEVVGSLLRAAEVAAVRVEAFSAMSVAQVAAACGLSRRAARLAKRRHYDEPFRIADPDPAARSRLLAALEDAGVRVLSGGRFDHAIGDADKGRAAAFLRRLYRKAFGPTTTVGLGDALNDAPLLRSVDVPIIVRGPSSLQVHQEVPWARITEAEGPAGWREAVVSILEERTKVWRGDTPIDAAARSGDAAGLSQPPGSVG